MNPRLRAFLEAIGLKAGASDEAALRFWQSLTGDNRAAADVLAQEAPSSGDDGDGEGDSDSGDGDGGDAAEPATDAANSYIVEPDAVGSLVDEARRQGQAQGAAKEIKRQKTIRGVAAAMGLDDGWIDTMISDPTVSAEAMMNSALEAQAASNSPLRTGGALNVRMGSDLNRDTIADAISDAVAVKAGQPIYVEEDGQPVVAGTEYSPSGTHNRVETRKPHDRAKQFRGMSFIEMAKAWLHAHGAVVTGMSRLEVAEAVINRHKCMALTGGSFMAAGGGHSTSDFPNILANTSAKILRAAFVETPTIWQQWCGRVTTSDLKVTSVNQLGEAPNLSAVGELAEYKDITINERKETYQVSKYGDIFSISIESIINDDLNAFNRIPRMMGNAAARKPDELSTAVLTANANMSDGVALFATTVLTRNANLVTSGGAPSVATLNVGRLAMRTQKGLLKRDGTASDVTLNIVPRFIMVPAAIEGTTRGLLNSEADPAVGGDVTGNSGVANIWRGALQILVNPRLDASDANAWYLMADPAAQDGVWVAFLEGQPTPSISESDGFRIDARSFKVSMWAAAAAIDFRGLFKNDGGA